MLHEAAARGHARLCRALLAAGASRNRKTMLGRHTALHLAAFHDQLPTVTVLVRKLASVTETDNSGDTVLHVAARRASLDIVRVLLDAGAEVNRKNDAGESAVHVAVARDHFPTFELLMERGGDYTVCDGEGRSVLDVAMSLRRGLEAELVLKLQLQAGAVKRVEQEKQRRKLEIRREVRFYDEMLRRRFGWEGAKSRKRKK
eukprot:PLAT6105.1.p1 GENE.PLAT6105.1~~PLAT6105.1.p1  ORF type:complete len:202 (+),score=57.23 PLAT6105.1:156-761(+)